MRFEPFLLDQWIERKFSTDWRIVHDFTASSGPAWTLRELLDVAGEQAPERFLDIKMGYPSAAGSLELRTAIADAEGVTADDVQIVTGAQEGLLAIFFTAAKPGANVIVPQPGFPPFLALPQAFGLEIRPYHLRRDNRFEIDPAEIERLVDDRTAVVLVNSPHNPTGTVLPEASRRTLHYFCAERDIQFVCDQVFHPQYYGGDVATAATLPHATVVGDFSKALCLPGLRIGWIVDRNHDRLERYREARMYFTISNGPLTEWLATLAMRHRHAIDARAHAVSRANLQVIESAWLPDDEAIGWIRPSGGFTIFPWLRDGSDTRPLCERLGERGILVVPGDCFGVPSHFRLGFGTQRECFAEAFDQLREGIDTYFAERRQRSAVVGREHSTSDSAVMPVRARRPETLVRRVVRSPPARSGQSPVRQPDRNEETGSTGVPHRSSRR
jgi:aspartate/methionine/tyrosine aminotransferase